VRWGALLAINLALAGSLAALSPAPRLTDRGAYDEVGLQPFAFGCDETIYCYRVLVPAMVHALPMHPDVGWRVYQVASNTAAGTLIAALTGTLSGSASAPFIAALLVQTSYGFAFTAYDPYAADPLVFVFAALLIWCWHSNRPWPAVALAAIGVFAKETVALMAGIFALAAIIARPPQWKRWMAPVLVSAAVLGTFHLISRLWLDWQIGSNPAAQMSHGSWLGLWWRNNPLLERKAYMVFATFGFAWLLASIGWRSAPREWRAVAIATIPAMAFLMVIQTPERALGNAFFVLVPLAVLFVSRSPAAGAAAIALNGLITAKAGTSSAWLPSARWTLIPAAIAAAIVILGVRWKK
jgi:hypothetical protein